MATIESDAINKHMDKIKKYTEKYNITVFDLLKAAFKRLLILFVKNNKNNKVAYTYNPLPKNKRAKLGEFITEHFKNKVEFAKEAGLDLSVLVALINNRRCGNALTWKKINDVFEKHEIKLPYDLQIKYEVVDQFG